MEVNKLYGFTLLLVLVGMIIGVGVLTLDKFSTAVYQNNDGGSQDNLILWTNNFTSTTDTTITASSVAAINSSNGVSVSVICNNLNQWSCSALKLASNTPASANGTAKNLTYTYGIDSVATDTLQASRGEVSTIASTWLGLIVTIMVLAIILTLVIRSFGSRQ